MPSKLMQCVFKGQKGWKAEGKNSKCYVGPDAREKAVAQVQAINISAGRQQGAEWAEKLPEPK